jgi:hypothetical protein
VQPVDGLDQPDWQVGHEQDWDSNWVPAVSDKNEPSHINIEDKDDNYDDDVDVKPVIALTYMSGKDFDESWEET